MNNKVVTIMIGGKGHGIKLMPSQESSTGLIKYGESYRPRRITVSLQGEEVVFTAFVMIDLPALRATELALSAISREFYRDAQQQ